MLKNCQGPEGTDRHCNTLPCPSLDLAPCIQGHLQYSSDMWPWLSPGKQLNCDEKQQEASSGPLSTLFAQQLHFSSGPCPGLLLELCCWPCTMLTMPRADHALALLTPALPCWPDFLVDHWPASLLWTCLAVTGLFAEPAILLFSVRWDCVSIHETTALLALLSPQLLSQFPLWSSPLLMLSDKNNNKMVS